MEKEISLSIQIGVTLMVLSVLITLVIFTVHMGNEIKVDAMGEGTRILREMEQGQLRDMVGKENYIPMAAAYNLLRTYSNNIPKLVCDVPGCKHTGEQNLVYETPCLKQHRGGITGKVSLEVTSPTEGEYHITIHPDTSWYH